MYVPGQPRESADDWVLPLQRPAVRRVGPARPDQAARLRDHRQLLGRRVPLL